MFVLHVSHRFFPNKQPTRLVFGCDKHLERTVETLQRLGYNVFESEEEFPEREEPEMEEVKMLLSLLYTVEESK